MTSTTAVDADRALKAKHRAMWALGDYPAVADRAHRRRSGPVLVDARRRPRPGTGSSTSPPAPATPRIPAARGRRARRRQRPDARAARRRPRRGRRAGASTRLAGGRRRGAAVRRRRVRRRAVLRRRDVRAAPPGRRRRAGPGRAGPGGTIGLLSWTPEGFIGQMFATMKPYAPPPPPGAQPPPLWGNEEHVRALLGDRVDRRRGRTRGRCRSTSFAHAGGVPRLLQGQLRPDDRGLPRASPTTRTGSPRSTRTWSTSARRFDLGGGAMEWEYLLVTARRR